MLLPDDQEPSSIDCGERSGGIADGDESECFSFVLHEPSNALEALAISFRADLDGELWTFAT